MSPFDTGHEMEMLKRGTLSSVDRSVCARPVLAPDIEIIERNHIRGDDIMADNWNRGRWLAFENLSENGQWIIGERKIHQKENFHQIKVC
jgi:hypothetical protein